MRLDQWLWAARLYKTRSLAANAVKAGHVTVNGMAAKPAKEVRIGETIVARTGDVTRTARVRGLPPSRVSAKLVSEFLEDLTPAEEYEKRRDPNFIPPMMRPKGAGRPTKRDRRKMEEL